MIGDNGTVTYDLDGNTVIGGQVISTQPGLAGNDDINSGSGNDILIGSSGNDVLRGGDGNDVLIGDGAKVTWKAAYIQVIESAEWMFGGDDTLVAGSGHSIMIGGAGHDALYGDIRNNLMIGETGRVVMNNGKVQSVYVSGSSLNLLAFSQSGLFSSPSTENNVSTAFRSFDATRHIDLHETVATPSGAGKSASWKMPELSHHSSAALTSQNIQQIIDFFEDLDFEDDGAADSPAAKLSGEIIAVTFVDGNTGSETNPVAHRQSYFTAVQTHGSINTPNAAAKDDDSMMLRALVAGYMGWNANTSPPVKKKVQINRETFMQLEQQGRNRKFQKWI
jgi:Ca2+-binding RTX toxin-like protein